MQWHRKLREMKWSLVATQLVSDFNIQRGQAELCSYLWPGCRPPPLSPCPGLHRAQLAAPSGTWGCQALGSPAHRDHWRRAMNPTGSTNRPTPSCTSSPSQFTPLPSPLSLFLSPHQRSVFLCLPLNLTLSHHTVSSSCYA